MTLCSSARPMIELRSVGKTYPTPRGPFAALSGVSLTLFQGEFAAIVGKSGSGKSTLLNLVAGLDRPSFGQVLIEGVDIGAMSESQRAQWRGRTVGVVFQFFQLLPNLTVLENLLLPMEFVGIIAASKQRAKALELLEQVGIKDQAHKLPGELSGGQQQRVAIARACANEPQVIVADEPTGNLDSHTAQEVLSLFAQLARQGKTVLMVTHERDISAFVDRTVRLVDGTVAPAPEVAHA